MMGETLLVTDVDLKLISAINEFLGKECINQVTNTQHFLISKFIKIKNRILI
jgi:hypothetical protein